LLGCWPYLLFRTRHAASTDAIEGSTWRIAQEGRIFLLSKADRPSLAARRAARNNSKLPLLLDWLISEGLAARENGAEPFDPHRHRLHRRDLHLVMACASTWSAAGTLLQRRYCGLTSGQSFASRRRTLCGSSCPMLRRRWRSARAMAAPMRVPASSAACPIGPRLRQYASSSSTLASTPCCVRGDRRSSPAGTAPVPSGFRNRANRSRRAASLV
jgi:hypothetical protein